MTFFRQYLTLAACALALSACGGGGSSSGGGTGSGEGSGGAPGNGWLTFIPNPISIDAVEGKPQTFTVNARSTKTISQVFNVAVVESTGLMSGSISTSMVTPYEYNATMATNANLAAGVHTGKLAVWLCVDDPHVCKQPIDGSPWSIPISINVKAAATTPVTPPVIPPVIPPVTPPVDSGVNLTPLLLLPAVPAWSTYQGNPAHTGAIVADLDGPRLNRRFILNTTGRYVRGSAHDGGNAFFIISQDGSWIVQSVSDTTGKEQWHLDLGPQLSVNPPAAANGKLYLVANSSGTDASLWVLDQHSGTIVTRQPMSAGSFLAPTIASGIYSANGPGGMVKFDSASNSQLWQTTLPQASDWTPAIDGLYAYTFLNGSLQALDSSDGRVNYTIPLPGYTADGVAVERSVIVSATGQAFASDASHLLGFDTRQRNISWSATGNFASQPALSGKMLYVLTAGGATLEARDTSSGLIQWTVGTMGGATQIIISNTLAFITSPTSTQAIDLKTRATVWIYPVGGHMAISNRGVLYIVSDSKVVAINLQ